MCSCALGGFIVNMYEEEEEEKNKEENEKHTTYRRNHAVRFANGTTASEERYQKDDGTNGDQCDWRHIDFGFFERI